MSKEKHALVKPSQNEAAMAPTPPEAPIFSWRYVLFLFVLGLGLTLSMSLLTMNLMSRGRSGTVPSVVGKTMTQAMAGLTRNGFILRKTGEAFSETVPADYIVSQNPAAGENLKKGRSVQVILSSGPALAEVPDLAGKTLTEAQIALESGRLALGQVFKVPSDGVLAGNVVAQSVQPGLQRNRGAVLDLLVSSGPQLQAFLMPDFKTKTWPEIYPLLSQAKILLGQVAVETRGDVPKQTILAQVPQSGERVQEGETVSFTVAAPADKGLANFIPVPFHVPDTGKQKAVRIVVIDDKGWREIFNDMVAAGSDIAPSAGLYGQCLVQYFVNSTLVQEKWLQ